MTGIRFDHIAIGLGRMADAPAVLVGMLGGRPLSGGPGDGFRWASWRYAGGGRIEVIEPAGIDGFLHRFLAQRGPGIHHVTFKVPSLEAVCARAAAHGYGVVGRDETDPTWKTAYLHPRQALGIVVQLGQSAGGGGPRPAAVPPGPPAPPPAVRVLGLRLRARDAGRVRRQWGVVLGGEESRGAGRVLVFRWPGSPMRIAVEVDPAAPEGPVAIELDGARPVGLPAGPVAPLGTAFVEGGQSS